MSHGGKREGAGRTRRTEPRVALILKVEPADAKRFKTLCRASKRSQSIQFTEMVRREEERYE